VEDLLHPIQLLQQPIKEMIQQLFVQHQQVVEVEAVVALQVLLVVILYLLAQEVLVVVELAEILQKVKDVVTLLQQLLLKEIMEDAEDVQVVVEVVVAEAEKVA
tara:strand:- start:395 stop:706 length:312 start_codon:yes stop_codon:yes gene_type:complete